MEQLEIEGRLAAAELRALGRVSHVAVAGSISLRHWVREQFKHLRMSTAQRIRRGLEEVRAEHF